MPYLKLFIRDRKLDETYISEALLQSVIGHHTLAGEKEKMLARHEAAISKTDIAPSFIIDNTPPPLNSQPFNKNRKDD